MIMNAVGRLLRWISAPLLLIIAFAAFTLLASACLHASDQLYNQGLKAWLWLFIPLAFCLRAILAWFFRRLGADNPLAFIDTLEHELTHAAFGYLTFHPPLSLKASLKGDGEVALRGKSLLAILAPYFFPLWTFIAVGITSLLESRFRFWATAFCMCLIGNFVFRWMAEFRWRQTDLHAYGFFFSSAFVACALAMSFGFLLAMLRLCPWHWPMKLPSASWQLMLSLWAHIEPWLQKAWLKST